MSDSRPSTRFALVDDRDARIQYDGPWFPAPISTIFDSRGYNGPPFNSTLTQSDSVGASITFTFTGYAFGFYSAVESTLSSRMPRYSCSIDGVGISSSGYSDDPFITNHYSLCEQTFLEDTRHTVTFTIDGVDATDNPILFDYIGYWPSPGASIGDTTEKVWFNDTRVSFSSGDWEPLEENEYVRNSTDEGASVTFKFEGESVSLLGLVLNGSYTDGRSSYTLDDDPAVSFTVPESISSIRTYWNYEFFNITGLSEGQHTLVVTDGTSHSGQQPLVVSAFQVRGRASDDPDGDSIIDGDDNDGGSSGGLSTGAKAGIAVGVIVAVALFAAAIAFLIYRRRQQRVHKNHIGKPQVLDMSHKEPSTPITPSSGVQLLTPGTADRPLSMAPNGAYTPYGQPPITMPMPMSSPNVAPPNGASFPPSFHTVAAPPVGAGGSPGVAGGARNTMFDNPDYQYLAANAYHHPPGIQDQR